MVAIHLCESIYDMRAEGWVDIFGEEFGGTVPILGPIGVVTNPSISFG